MTLVYEIPALALLCCATFHLQLAWEFRAPRWRAQMVWALAVAATELASAVALAVAAVRGG